MGNGFQRATTAPAIIAAWWGSWPDANIGIATGAISNLVVIDIDTKEGVNGPATLTKQEKQLGPLPITVRSITGSGGEHIFLRHPGTRIASSQGSSNALGDGADVRGDGGYIIAPGSDHKSGGLYHWNPDHHPDGIVLADIPIEWLRALQAGNRRDGGQAPAAPIVDATGKRIDGREERARNIRLEVFLELQEETGKLPTLEEWGELSWQKFASECALGPTSKSSNSYDWSAWWKTCTSDFPRLVKKKTIGLIANVKPAHPSRTRLSITAAEKKLAATLKDWAVSPRNLLIRMTAGGGKTSMAIKVIAQAIKASSEPLVIHWFGPDHKVLEETCQKLIAEGVRAMVVQGRERAGCQDPDAVKAAVEASLPVQVTCCKGCRWLDECAYQQQFSWTHDVYLFPRQHITLERDSRIPAADLNVVDEEFLGELIKPRYQHGVAVADIEAVPLGRMIAEGLREGKLTREWLAERWSRHVIGTSRNGAAAGDVLTGLKAVVEGLQAAHRAQIREVIIAQQTIGRKVRLDGVGKRHPMIEIGCAILGEWHSSLPLRSLVLRNERLYVRRLHEHRLNAPTLFLDATAEEDLLHLVFPDIEICRIDIERNLKTTQVFSTRAAKRTLLKGRGSDNLIRKCQRVINKTAEGHPKGLIVTYMATKELFSVPDGWAIEHFGGSVRGTNAYEDHTAVVVIGRNQLPHGAIEDFIASLVFGSAVEVDFSERKEVEQGFRKADKAEVGVMAQSFPDPLMRAADRLRLDAETEQVVDRLRGTRAQETKEAVIVSSHPVDLDVDELLTIKEASGWGLIDRALDEAAQGVLPLGADWLTGNMPDLFESERTAGRAAADWLRVSRCQIAIESSIRQFGTLKLVSYRLRSDRGGRPRRAILLPGMTYQQAQEVLEDLHDEDVAWVWDSRLIEKTTALKAAYKELRTMQAELSVNWRAAFQPVTLSEAFRRAYQ